MRPDPRSIYTDRQARAIIVAAEAQGFEREPELLARWYDHALHEDATEAAGHLEAVGPEHLSAALVAPDPVPAWAGAWRVMEEGRVNMDEAGRFVELAGRHGFEPPEDDLPLMDSAIAWGRGRAALAFLWEHHPEDLAQFDDRVWIAPLPETANESCRHCFHGMVSHPFAGELPSEPDGRYRHRYM